MFTYSGTMEAGGNHFDVVAAHSFVDLTSVVNPEPLIQAQPELFVADWQGDTEVVVLMDHEQLAAAGVLRSRKSDDNTFEVYAIGETVEGVDRSVLREALRSRVAERKAAMPSTVRTKVYWGEEPADIVVSPTSPTVGVTAYAERLDQSKKERVARFLQDLLRP